MANNLKEIISCHIGNNGEICQYFRSSKFINCNVIESYYPNFNQLSIFENFYIKKTNIVCDSCQNTLSSDLITKFWHNSNCGDLCNNCFSNKQKYEAKRHKYLVHKMLLEGRKTVFKKQLVNTKKYLSNLDLNNKKLSDKSKLSIYKNINQELMTYIFQSDKRNECPICYDLLYDDISAGTCGHCFHTKCVNIKPSLYCPLCRTKTDFFKLFLYKN